ncbi:hypothetical protein QQ056_02710 [Oscillatoria laete-virens NRMC-F 0139]|nr:hypothetical protein [Oscillatoria laete-virens]MDL5052474.1 hypothetical protein [Oscillatoria laete-virens NRMC-F 0139]
MDEVLLGRYLSLTEFCTCTQTYRQYAELIHPFPENPQETIPALQALNQQILDPIIEHFGRSQFQLTYGFCSPDLRKFLERKDPITGLKNGRVAPHLDQHMAHEVKKTTQYYCDRLGAACDFRILNTPSCQVVEWILQQKLPFDSLYFYGSDRPIHISYGPQHKRDIWTFTQTGVPTRKGIEGWLNL